jgi:hypothetical protein
MNIEDIGVYEMTFGNTPHIGTPFQAFQVIQAASGLFFFTAREILVKFFRGLKCSAKRRKFLATQSGVVKE